MDAKVEDVDNRARTGIAELQAAVGNVENNAKKSSQAKPDYTEVRHVNSKFLCA